MLAEEFAKLCLKTEELKLPTKFVRLGYVKVIDLEKDHKDLDNLLLTKKGEAFINEVTLVPDDLTWITTEYRKKFKDCNATKYGIKIECERKVVQIMEENNATKEEVLMAVDKYIDSLAGNYANNFMASADYFALFTDANKNSKSKLSQYIELVRSKESEWSKNVV